MHTHTHTRRNNIPFSRYRSIIVQMKVDNTRLTADWCSTEVKVNDSSGARRRTTIMTETAHNNNTNISQGRQSISLDVRKVGWTGSSSSPKVKGERAQHLLHPLWSILSSSDTWNYRLFCLVFDDIKSNVFFVYLVFSFHQYDYRALWYTGCLPTYTTYQSIATSFLYAGRRHTVI